MVIFFRYLVDANSCGMARAVVGESGLPGPMVHKMNAVDVRLRVL
jgi:hypothetical protein